MLQTGRLLECKQAIIIISTQDVKFVFFISKVALQTLCLDAQNGDLRAQKSKNLVKDRFGNIFLLG